MAYKTTHKQVRNYFLDTECIFFTPQQFVRGFNYRQCLENLLPNMKQKHYSLYKSFRILVPSDKLHIGFFSTAKRIFEYQRLVFLKL